MSVLRKETIEEIVREILDVHETTLSAMNDLIVQFNDSVILGFALDEHKFMDDLEKVEDQFYTMKEALNELIHDSD